MKSIGLVGVPYSGKTTLFTALTKAGVVGGRANQAVVPVPDPRLDVLAEMERSRKVVPAQVRFVDVPGGATAHGLAALRETDALCVVLRAFGPAGDPAGELEELRAELLLADLAVVESALENSRKRAKGRGPGAAEELAALEAAQASLSAETPLREADMEEDRRKALRGLSLLTLKPLIVVANLEEGSEIPAGLPEGTIGVWAEIEAETAGMEPEEARVLLREFGVNEPGLEKVIAAGYRALKLITFLTTGEDETRAWEVRRGATAPEAAGVIHSDLQRGFIRAEVISFDELVAAGGWDAAKHRGHIRVEGKDYVVQEGDVIHVRFAV
jgi:ribosome-binding ATPase